MNSLKEIHIKTCTYYFFGTMINIKNLDPNKKKKVIQKYSYLFLVRGRKRP